MKKIIFLMLTAILLWPLSSTAQFVTGLGIKGGVTLSDQNYTFTYVPDYKHRLKFGFNGSVFAEFLNNRYINIIAETGYDQRGFEWVLDRTDEFGNYIGEGIIAERTNYIFTALGAKLKYKDSRVTPYILVLPRLDFYLGYNINLFEDMKQYEDQYKDQVLEDFKKIMFGIGVGAGIEFNRLLPFKVFAEVNYNPGIINSISTYWVKVKEYSFNFKLGINFIKEKAAKKRGK